MEDFIEEFLAGEEVKAIKAQLKALSTSEIVFAIISFLVVLIFLPRTTIAATLLVIFSLILTHFVNKWKKTQ